MQSLIESFLPPMGLLFPFTKFLMYLVSRVLQKWAFSAVEIALLTMCHREAMWYWSVAGGCLSLTVWNWALAPTNVQPGEGTILLGQKLCSNIDIYIFFPPKTLSFSSWIKIWGSQWLTNLIITTEFKQTNKKCINFFGSRLNTLLTLKLLIIFKKPKILSQKYLYPNLFFHQARCDTYH